MARVTSDWDTNGKDNVKRMGVLVQPLPGGSEKVGAMLARVTRRYVHMKRNFLVKSDVARAAEPDRAAECEGLDALLWLRPTAKAVGDGIELDVKASLVRCSDGFDIWMAEAGGSFKAYDEGLKEVAATYGREYGGEVERFVPAAMNVLRPMLDTLPDPVLTEADVEEKMTLDE